jgi:hypothetical protein
MQKYPELSKEWIKDEELIGHTYFKDKSMKDLLNIANYLKKTKQYNLFEIEPAFDCACNS